MDYVVLTKIIIKENQQPLQKHANLHLPNISNYTAVILEKLSEYNFMFHRWGCIFRITCPIRFDSAKKGILREQRIENISYKIKNSNTVYFLGKLLILYSNFVQYEYKKFSYVLSYLVYFQAYNLNTTKLFTAITTNQSC